MLTNTLKLHISSMLTLAFDSKQRCVAVRPRVASGTILHSVTQCCLDTCWNVGLFIYLFIAKCGFENVLVALRGQTKLNSLHTCVKL